MAITGGNPLDYSAADYDFLGATGPEAAALLAADLQVGQDNVEALEAATADGNEALHGTGSEAVAGDVLAVGSGLSVHILNAGYWIAGRRYVIDEGAGYLVGAIPANATSYLYLDADGLLTAYGAQQTPNPTGTWYCGTAISDSSACLSVDDSGADRVVTAAVVDAALNSGADIAALEDALGTDWYVDGEPVTPAPSTVTERFAALGGSGVLPPWKDLQYDPPADSTTIMEAIQAAVGAGGGSGGGGGGTTTVVQVPDAVSAANHLRLELRLMHALPEVEQTQKWAYLFVPGISDDSLYDAALTTATVDKVNHTIGA